MSWVRLWLCTVLAAVVAAVYRLAVFDGLSNDHYMHLAWAQQLLHGEVPGRDFDTPGMPLTIALSAVAQWLAGPGPLPELVLCVIFLSLTAGLTFWLGARITGSPQLGLAAAGLEIALTPRLYNYPKLFVPIVGLCIIWPYLERPSARRAMALGCWLAVGFLFRHDFLVYLGLTSLVALVAAHSASPARAARHIGACAAAALIVVLPYLGFVEATTGLGTHLDHGRQFARQERWGIDRPHFVVAPPMETLDTRELPLAGPTKAAVRGAWLDAIAFASPIVNRANVVVVLFWIGMALPALLLVRSVTIRRVPQGLEVGVRDAGVLSLATLTLAQVVMFFRSPIEARIADVAGPLSLVIVCAISLVWRRNYRFGAWSTVTVLLAASVLHGNVWNRVYATGVFDGAGAVAERLGGRWAEFREWPWASAWPNGDLPPVIRYLDACTEPDDRVFVTWFAPEIHVFANRRFAAGHAYLLGRSYLSTEHQERMIRRLERQNVPVVLLNRLEPWFARRYPLVAGYIDEHYDVAGTYRTGKGEEIVVATRRDKPAMGPDDATGWPCFRERA